MLQITGRIMAGNILAEKFSFLRIDKFIRKDRSGFSYKLKFTPDADANRMSETEKELYLFTDGGNTPLQIKVLDYNFRPQQPVHTTAQLITASVSDCPGVAPVLWRYDELEQGGEESGLFIRYIITPYHPFTIDDMEMSAMDIICMAMDVCNILIKMNNRKEYVHGGICPENILFDQDKQQVWLTGFENAQPVDDVWYFPQTGKHVTDVQRDMEKIAGLISGFDAPHRLTDDLPQLGAIVRKAMAHRYTMTEEMYADLAALLGIFESEGNPCKTEKNFGVFRLPASFSALLES